MFPSEFFFLSLLSLPRKKKTRKKKEKIFVPPRIATASLTVKPHLVKNAASAAPVIIPSGRADDSGGCAGPGPIASILPGDQPMAGPPASSVATDAASV